MARTTVTRVVRTGNPSLLICWTTSQVWESCLCSAQTKVSLHGLQWMRASRLSQATVQTGPEIVCRQREATRGVWLLPGGSEGSADVLTVFPDTCLHFVIDCPIKKGPKNALQKIKIHLPCYPPEQLFPLKMKLRLVWFDLLLTNPCWLFLVALFSCRHSPLFIWLFIPGLFLGFKLTWFKS